MGKMMVADLISKTEQALLQLRYSEVSMAHYRGIFKKIAAYHAARNETYFDERVAMAWLDDECHFSAKEKRKELTQGDMYLLRMVKTLNSVANDERIPAHYVRKIPEFADETLMRILDCMSEFSKSCGYAKSTQYLHRKTAASLFKFMSERGIAPSNTTPQVVSGFIRACDGYTKKTMESKLYALRIITKFLYDEGIAEQDCSKMLPKASAPRFTTLPSIWAHEDIVKLLAVIDKNSPIGKRDYAILLLAFRLGVRGCDIKRLQIENFDFKDKKEVRFIQSKTGATVVLPLLPDVGWAVLNYLKDGRPNSDSPHIFITHAAPYGQLAEDNHMLPPNMLPKSPHYTPYIYSNDELRRYFEQTDNLAYYNPAPYRHLVLPLLFRLLYACGLRVTETTLIKFGEVDTENGIITINNAKGGRIRQIPVSVSMLARIKDYCEQVHKNSQPDAWFFPYSRDGSSHISRSTVDSNHLDFLRKAGISHCGKSREPGKPGGPRIHDFRHTFAVHCLRRWAFGGKDIGAMMPYLQTYMGHATQSETVYYLHLTADVFPQITTQLENALGAIVPAIPLEVWENGY